MAAVADGVVDAGADGETSGEADAVVESLFSFLLGTGSPRAAFALVAAPGAAPAAAAVDADARSAAAGLEAARAGLRQAELDLSYTRIAAPQAELVQCARCVACACQQLLATQRLLIIAQRRSVGMAGQQAGQVFEGD